MMKYFFLLSLVFSHVIHAANPDQDLLVDLVRERFAASRVATLGDVKLGKTWNCAIYSGQRGLTPNYNTYRELFRFEKEEGSKLMNTEDFLFSYFDLTKDGYVSTADGSQLYMRVAKNSALVFERVGKQPKTHKAYRAISDSKLRGLDYIYCK